MSLRHLYLNRVSYHVDNLLAKCGQREQDAITELQATWSKEELETAAATERAFITKERESLEKYPHGHRTRLCWAGDKEALLDKAVMTYPAYRTSHPPCS